MSKGKELNPYGFKPLHHSFFDSPGKTTWGVLKREDVKDYDIKYYDAAFDEAKELMLEGDEFGDWMLYINPLCAQGGYCIIRDGKPVYLKGVWLS